MMCRYSFGREDAAAAVEQAVESLLKDGMRTADIAAAGERPVPTREFGEETARRIE